MFSCDFCKSFQNSFSVEHLWIPASVYLCNYLQPAWSRSEASTIEIKRESGLPIILLSSKFSRKRYKNLMKFNFKRFKIIKSDLENFKICLVLVPSLSQICLCNCAENICNLLGFPPIVFFTNFVLYLSGKDLKRAKQFKSIYYKNLLRKTIYKKCNAMSNDKWIMLL